LLFFFSSRIFYKIKGVSGSFSSVTPLYPDNRCKKTEKAPVPFNAARSAGKMALEAGGLRYIQSITELPELQG